MLRSCRWRPHPTGQERPSIRVTEPQFESPVRSLKLADPSSRSARARLNEELTPETQQAWVLVSQQKGAVKSKRHLLAVWAVIPLALRKVVPCHDSIFVNIGGSGGHGRKSVLRDLT